MICFDCQQLINEHDQKKDIFLFGSPGVQGSPWRYRQFIFLVMLCQDEHFIFLLGKKTTVSNILKLRVDCQGIRPAYRAIANKKKSLCKALNHPYSSLYFCISQEIQKLQSPLNETWN